MFQYNFIQIIKFPMLISELINTCNEISVMSFLVGGVILFSYLIVLVLRIKKNVKGMRLRKNNLLKTILFEFYCVAPFCKPFVTPNSNVE